MPEDGDSLLQSESGSQASSQSGVSQWVILDEEDDHSSVKNLRYSRIFPVERREYESLDYDEYLDAVHAKDSLHASDSKVASFRSFIRWLFSMVVGLLVGFIAVVFDTTVFWANKLKFLIIGSVSPALGFTFSVVLSTVVVVIGAALIAFLEPLAVGTGVAEMKGHLNGVKIPRLTRFRTIAVRFLATLCSLGGGLFVGISDVLVNLGGSIAAGVPQGKSITFPLDTGWLMFLRNDKDKLDFMASGAAAGFAAIFNAPVAGTLFVLEDCASFWNPRILWRIFLSAMAATFVYNVFFMGWRFGIWNFHFNSIYYSFGRFHGSNAQTWRLAEVPLFVVLGLIGAVIGIAIVKIHLVCHLLRLKYVRTNAMRLVEAGVIGIISAVLVYLISDYLGACSAPPNKDDQIFQVDRHRFFCDKGQYNDLASLYFTSFEQTFHQLLHSGMVSSLSLFLFSTTYFVMTSVTVGATMSGGIVLPSLFIGCGYGKLMGRLVNFLLPSLNVDEGTYALLGAASTLTGVTRITISVAAFVIEVTNDISYLLPVGFTLYTTKLLADVLSSSFYYVNISLAHQPFLDSEPPHAFYHYDAKDVMNTPLVCLRPVERVSKIVSVLKQTTHNGFPIVELRPGGEKKPFGLISRSVLVVCLKNKVWFGEPRADVPTPRNSTRRTAQLGIADFAADYPRFPSVEELEFTQEELSKAIELTPYMNSQPVSVHKHVPLHRVFRLFRSMGLRHLLVVNDHYSIVGMITRKDLTNLEEMPGLEPVLENLPALPD